MGEWGWGGAEYVDLAEKVNLIEGLCVSRLHHLYPGVVGYQPRTAGTTPCNTSSGGLI